MCCHPEKKRDRTKKETKVNKIIFIVFTLVCYTTACKPVSKNPHPEPEKKKKEIIIGIISFHTISQNLVEFSAKEIENFYGVKTDILERGSLPDSLKKPYPKRYNANKIIDYLNIIKPKNLDYLLGLTDAKIATKKGNYKEWGILGLGQNPGPCCIVSTSNMGRKQPILCNRLSKVCLHEMGHNFGLPHCVSGDTLCFMRDAKGSIKTVDAAQKYICKYCKGYLTSKGFKINPQAQI